MALVIFSMKASADMLGLFQYWVTASCMAPEKFGGLRISMLSTWLAGSFRIEWDFWAQTSMEDTSTSMRTGIEPFFLLNSSWLVGSRRTSMSLSWVASAVLSFVAGSTKT